MVAYEAKVKYLFHHQKALCPICRKYMLAYQHLSLDHRHHNKGYARRNYPLFIDSLLNLQLTHIACNIDKRRVNKYKDRTTPYLAWKAEDFLRRHEKIAKWVNYLED